MSGSSIGTVSNPDAFERYVPDDTTVGTRVKPFAAGDEPSFSDFIDVINPLQHIPIISTIYRSLTGDEIGSAARIAGGTLYGGPIGLAFAVADVAVEDASGLAIEGHALALLRGEDMAAGATQMAQAAPARPQAAPMQLASAAVQDSSLPPPVAAAPQAAVIQEAAPAAAAAPVTLAMAQPAPVAEAGTHALEIPPSNPVAELPPLRGNHARFQELPVRNAAAAQAKMMPAPARPSAAPEPRPVKPDALAMKGLAPGQSQGSAHVSSAGNDPRILASAAAGSQPAQPQDWFTGNMLGALDKYEQMNRIGRKS